jgi:simple sugar transport system permease protein
MSTAESLPSPETLPQPPLDGKPAGGASRAWWLSLWQTVFLPVLSVLLALAAGGLILLLTGYDPVRAYEAMWQGVFGSTRNFSEVLLKATPLIFTGVGIAVAFRCGVWNIGAEGQFYAGAVAATWVGINGGDLPKVILIPLVLGAGFLGGGLWAVIPGWLKVRLNISEVVTTIMFNYIAIGITSYLVTGPLQEAAGIFPQSDEIVASAQLPRIWLPTRLHLGFLIAVGLALLLTVILFRTPLGYAIRTVGLSPGAARYAGMGVDRNIVVAMLLSGGAAGLGGAIELTGLTWRLFATISPGYGFDGIAVSLLVNNHPFGTIFSGLLFGALRAASELMQMNARIPSVLILIIQGLVIAFVVAFRMIRWRSVFSRRFAAKE